jgi:predicted N-acetyltransferase YhbS
MTNPFTIRPETLADRAAVATVLARTYLADGAAAIAMLSALRDMPGFMPELALVGSINSKISAFAALTKVAVGGKPGAALLLSPIALDTQNPEATNTHWVEAVLAEVGRLGHRYVLVQGEPGVYLPCGFVPAKTLGVFDSSSEDSRSQLLVKDLAPSTPATLQGEVEYPHA